MNISYYNSKLLKCPQGATISEHVLAAFLFILAATVKVSLNGQQASFTVDNKLVTVQFTALLLLSRRLLLVAE